MTQLDPAHLARRNELGRLNLEEQEREFASVVDLAKDLMNLPLDQLPPQASQDLASSLNDVRHALARVGAFDPTQGGDVQGLRTKIMGQFSSAYTTLAQRAMAALPYLAFKAGRGHEQLQALTQAVGEIGKIKAEAEAAAGAARDAAASIGAGKFSQLFKESAGDHEKAANKWLWVTGGLMVGTLAAALLVLFGLPAEGEV